MPDDIALTQAFVERHPESAARVLLAAEAAAAASLLAALPPKPAARLLATAGPWPAARVLQPMPDGSAVAVLREMRDVDAAQILRLVDVADRDRILATAPADFRRRLASSLDYPVDSAGGRMTTSILMLEADTTATAALDVVRKAKAAVADVVFAVEAGSQPLGAVSVAALLQSPATEVLSAVSDRDFPFVPANTAIVAAADERVWRDAPAVGVVDDRRRLIGALTRSALDVTGGDSRQGTPPTADTLLDSVSGAMFDSLSGLWTLFGDRNTDSTGGRGDR